jgi:hypothetical protein
MIIYIFSLPVVDIIDSTDCLKRFPTITLTSSTTSADIRAYLANVKDILREIRDEIVRPETYPQINKVLTDFGAIEIIIVQKILKLETLVFKLNTLSSKSTSQMQLMEKQQSLFRKIQSEAAEIFLIFQIFETTGILQYKNISVHQPIPKDLENRFKRELIQDIIR